MNKLLYSIITFAALCSTGQGFAGGLGGTNITVRAGLSLANCIGNSPNCSSNVTLNAVGENEIIDVKKYKVTSFGDIKDDTKVDLEIPVEKNTQKIYSFKPTQGELAGKMIYLAFDNIPPRLGSIASGKVAVKMYSQNESQKANEWTDVGNMTFDQAAAGEKLTQPFTIKPDGTLVSYDPKRKVTVEYPLGKSKLA